MTARSGELRKAICAGWLGLSLSLLGTMPGRAEEPTGLALTEYASSYRVLRLEGHGVRWARPRDGRDLVISYAVVTAPQAFPGARNCRKMTSLDELLSASSVANATFRSELAAAFAMWEDAADLRFREAGRGEQADILIGAQVDPEGWAFADVFYDTESASEIKSISRSLVCLNPARRWKVGFDGDLKTYDLRYTLAHEIGHAIGLDHPNTSGQIMGYRYDERFRTLQPGDVKGAVALYGSPSAGRATEAAATLPSQAQATRRLARRWGTRALNAHSR